MSRGLVYILTNPCLDGWVKIGMTERNDIERRLQELNSPPNIPLSFRCYATYEVENPLDVERRIHSLIDRVDDSLHAREQLNNGRIREREFFKISPETAYGIFKDIAALRGDGNKLHLYTPTLAQAQEQELAESYNEKTRRGQAFEADLSQYDEKHQGTIKKAVESGILNNTRRTHEFVDFIAKISADKGVLFDFTNNENLKNSSYAVEGKTVNGFIDESGSVVLNINSAKSLNSTAGHEITHILEGTELYQPLSDIITEYAKTKGEYDSRLSALNKLYEGVYKGEDFDTKVQKELVADLVGDYIFTDKAFVQKLSTENRNIFQKIYDEIKYLCKVATAGSKEARELEKVKKTFAEVYRESGKAQKSTAENSGVKYSLSRDEVRSWNIAWDSNDYSTLKEQLREHIDEINKMQPVATVVYNKQSSKPYYKVLDELLRDNFGYKIQRKEYGTITFDSGSIEGVRNYINNDAEAAAIISAPYVLKRGKAITGHKNHKGKENVSVTFAAPVVLNKQIGNVAVCVMYGKGQVHSLRVLTPEGKTFELLKIEDTESTITGHSAKAMAEPHIDPVSNNSIHNPNEDVKQKEVFGFKVNENADVNEDLLEELSIYHPEAEVDNKGNITVYHRTSKENADKIRKSGIMTANEDALYFSSKESGYASDYGDTVISFKIPSTELRVNDIFEGEVHFDLPLKYKNGAFSLDVSRYLTESNDNGPDKLSIKKSISEQGEIPIKNGNYNIYGSDVKLEAEPTENTEDIAPVKESASLTESIETESADAKTDLEKAVADYVESNIETIENDLDNEVLSREPKNIFAGTRKGYVRRLSNGIYESGTFGEGSGIVMNENVIRTDSLEEAISAQYKYMLENSDGDVSRTIQKHVNNYDNAHNATVEDIAPVTENIAGKTYISMEDFANQEGSVWNNVDFNDDATKKSITQETHNNMVSEGSVVVVSDEVLTNVEQSFPDLRTIKKKERTPILKEAMNKLKNNIRQFLNNFKNQSFEFEVNGKVLEAKLYNTGINEVLEKVTQEKANILYSTKDIFKNARYLYSTPDYDGDPNVYRWNYFYTPVQIGENVVGVRIAVRDVVKGTREHAPESQIYNWGIKKDTSLDGESYGPKVASSDVSSDVSAYSISDIAPVVNTENIAPVMDDTSITEEEAITQANENLESVDKADEEGQPKTRKQLHHKIIDNIKSVFSGKGFDFDNVLKKAKNLSTFSTVDNTPQRVMEKALGYKEGQALADLTVNKVAHNETEGIKWLNSFTDRKNGLLAQLSKQYNIKSGSKESAAAQMYAEGFYVDKNNDIVAYGDAELAKDFPDVNVQNNIKGLASDPRIRQIYDETLNAINESRVRNAYPEIQRLDNYFLHFRAMDDTFSRLGLPFNPNDIRAKDLPTDLNGVTADLKPGQPYFASANHRTGKRTSFDLLGGLERYLTSAKNQIYHIDDIQTLRALRNYIADNYGQANGLEGIDALTEEEAQERIEKVYSSHLSTFAKFLNEEANVLAGKTTLIDRGLEGVIGRRGMTFMDSVRKQVGSNMIGFNVSSSLTNLLAGVQAIAKTNKFACIKSLAQTTASRIGYIFGKTDSFVENNPTIIRRKGAERFHRTPFQKVGDAGYFLMSAVDNVTTEFIVRAKYNEFIKKGMSEEQAITEADKWTSRLMGDRSLGQMPQIYNSKTLGLITQFQLEVRNQLDSQFYDTIQEAKASNEDIQNGIERNAKTAAKVTKTFFELAVLQHLFGKGFEAVAGYNPAFDIIGVLATALGFDDDEESEDTALDNIEQGFLELLEDLPYTSVLTNGGRIPISSALPIKEIITGKDEYGNEKSRLDTLKETVPYYLLPTGYGQIKKTTQGLSMFDINEDHPVAGSYTDSGNLRFPVEDTLGNRIQAGIFGQYANENAREYFDSDYAPLKEKEIQEYKDVDIPIKDYWKYREGLKGLETTEEKFDYIDSLDLPLAKKNILANNVSNREEDVDLNNYDDFSSLEEFDFATHYPEKYAVAKSVGGYTAYKTYTSELYDIKADKDNNGKAISGSRKEKVVDYINNLNIDYYEKIILFKNEYNADDTYNYEIIDYLNSREDISYAEMEAILKELGFTVLSDGTIRW